MDFNLQNTRQMLEKHGIRFSKAMGQNFLADAGIPEKIVRLSGVDSSCGVLEAGPGLGALTLALGRAAGRVTAVELDSRLLPVLGETLRDTQNIEVVRGDILELDLAQLVRRTMPGLEYHVCANLPYCITTPALTAFIEAGIFRTITVMVQKEVAQRICARPGTPEYGAFTVFANYHTSPQVLFDVPPECFIPRPKVVSSVIRMTARERLIPEKDDEALFFRFVRAAFAQRRKTLVNALFSVFGGIISKNELAEAIIACGFGEMVRGEKLSISDFTRLSAELKRKFL